MQATEVGGTHPALVEVMGFGNPIIANDVPEHRETLGDAGLYHRGHAELAENLQLVLDNAALRADLREWAHQRATEMYGWDAVTEVYEAWFAGLAHLPHSGGRQR